MSSVIIGIDPGLKGGIALIRKGVPVKVWKMPVIKSGTKSILNLQTLNEILAHCKSFADFDGCLVVLERVHAMPKQGVVSVFTFGEGYGTIKGMAVAHGLGLMEVRPTEWQSALLQGIPKDLGKKRSIAYCLHRFSGLGTLSDGEADAICLGLYGSRQEV